MSRLKHYERTGLLYKSYIDHTSLIGQLKYEIKSLGKQICKTMLEKVALLTQIR
jgi:hypothetical protein